MGRKARTELADQKFKKLMCNSVEGRQPRLSKDGVTYENIDYEALWGEFTSMVKSNGKCRDGILQDVRVESGGIFSFECSEAEELCDCIVKVGVTGVEPHFYVEDGDYKLALDVFRDNESGYVSYKIKEGDEYIDYGDVNDGRVDRRRRRL